MKSIFAFSIVMGSLLLANVPQAEAQPKCTPRTSCINAEARLSLIPAKMSKMPVPLYCVNLVKGSFDPRMLETCETFALGLEGTPQQRAIAYVNIGDAKMFSGKADGSRTDAIEAWDHAIAVDQTFAEAYVSKALMLSETYHYEEGLQVLAVAEKQDPKAWRIYSTRAKLLVRWKKYEEAMSGKPLLGWKKYDEVLPNAEKAVALAPENPSAHFALAEVYEEFQRYDDAILQYSEAGKDYDSEQILLPGIMQDRDPWMAVAHIEKTRKNYPAALFAANKVVDGVNGHKGGFDFQGSRGEILELMGRFKEASIDYEAAAGLHSTGGNAMPEWAAKYRLKTAIMLARAGDQHAASQAFENFLRTGTLKNILVVQLFLRNSGFDDLEIDGMKSKKLADTLDKCMSQSKCLEIAGRSL